MTYKNIIFSARELRKSQTNAEETLWKALRNRQMLRLKFRRQHNVVGFIIDFYCASLKLGIEVDGVVHNKRDNKIYDKIRENIIKQYNIKIIRIQNSDIENNLNETMENIKKYIKRLPSLRR